MQSYQSPFTECWRYALFTTGLRRATIGRTQFHLLTKQNTSVSQHSSNCSAFYILQYDFDIGGYRLCALGLLGL